MGGPQCRMSILRKSRCPLSKFLHTKHKKPSVSSHTLAPTTICDLSHSVCRSPLTDLGHISSVTYVCHPLWFVCGHRKGILTPKSPMSHVTSKIPERHMSILRNGHVALSNSRVKGPFLPWPALPSPQWLVLRTPTPFDPPFLSH